MNERPHENPPESDGLKAIQGEVEAGRTLYVCLGRWDGLRLERRGRLTRLCLGWLVIGWLRGDLEVLLMAVAEMAHALAEVEAGVGETTPAEGAQDEGLRV